MVQGLAEFLPISSSGHLILVPAFLGWEDQGLAFDVGLHVGTFVALFAYFWRDWLAMTTATAADVASHKLAIRRYSQPGRLLTGIVVGTVPAALVGVLFDDWVEANLRTPTVVAFGLIAGAALLWVADHTLRSRRTVAELSLPLAFGIGLGQALALIPGVSRSGATLTFGLFAGLDRPTAARFSFLLGTPAFVGAGLLEAPVLRDASAAQNVQLAIGLLTSATVGLFVIHVLLGFLRTRTLLPFVVYRLCLGATVLMLISIGAI